MKLSIVITLLCVAFVATVEANNLRRHPTNEVTNERLLGKRAQKCKIEARAKAKTLARKEERIEARAQARAGAEGRDEAKVLARIEARVDDLESVIEARVDDLESVTGDGVEGHHLMMYSYYPTIDETGTPGTTKRPICLEASEDGAGAYLYYNDCSESKKLQRFTKEVGKNGGTVFRLAGTQSLCISIDGTLQEGDQEFTLNDVEDNQFEIINNKSCLGSKQIPETCEFVIVNEYKMDGENESCAWTWDGP